MHKTYFCILLVLFTTPLACARVESASSSVQIPDKFQVCSITLNSRDELEMFKKNLKPERFDFVELVPQKYDVDHQKKPSWFSQSCQRPKLSCDVLVVSGHFAEVFFGSSQHSLSLKELEKMACQNSCPQVFSNLKEVYLFGCNTMASKTRSVRTPEQYRNILVNEYDIPRDIAEIIVGSRYSLFSPTFKEKMEHVFAPSTKIYGFVDLSPLGEQARSLLQNYFGQIQQAYKGYYEYLVYNFYKNPSIKARNHHFINSMSVVSGVDQSHGLSPAHPKYETYNQICSLYSNKEPIKKQLEITKNLLKKGEGLFAYPAIKEFLIKRAREFTVEHKNLLSEIKSIQNVKDQFVRAYQNMNPHLIYIRSQVLHFLKIFSWIETASYQKEIRKLLLSLVQNPRKESFHVLSGLVYHDKLNPKDISISYDDLGKNYFNNLWSVLVVDTLKIQGPRVEQDLMNFCLSVKQKDSVICYQVLKTLGNIKVKNKKVIHQMDQFLSDPDPGIIFYSTYGLAYSNVQDPKIQINILKNAINHEDDSIRLQSLKALNRLKVIRSGSYAKELIQGMLKHESNQMIRNEIQSILNST